MQERKRNLVVWKVALAIALLMGFVLYETQVYSVGYKTRIGLVIALLFGFLTYVYTIFSLFMGPFIAITAMEENDVKVAAILIVVLILMASFIQLVFWGIIAKQMAFIVTGICVGIAILLIIVAVFRPRK